MGYKTLIVLGLISNVYVFKNTLVFYIIRPKMDTYADLNRSKNEKDIYLQNPISCIWQ